MYKLVRLLLLVLLALNISNCNDTNVAPPRPTPIVVDTDYCKAAEVHLLELKCPVAQPTKKGVPFEEFCKQTQNAGVFVNPRCLASVRDCQSVDYCTFSR